MFKIALPCDSEESFERIGLKKFSDTLPHIRYGISGADFGRKKESFTMKKLSRQFFTFSIFFGINEFLFQFLLTFSKICFA